MTRRWNGELRLRTELYVYRKVYQGSSCLRRTECSKHNSQFWSTLVIRAQHHACQEGQCWLQKPSYLPWEKVCEEMVYRHRQTVVPEQLKITSVHLPVIQPYQRWLWQLQQTSYLPCWWGRPHQKSDDCNQKRWKHCRRAPTSESQQKRAIRNC